jgi:crotonobetainyl-CoA:carnitine CoA-transferase CaiB-like acyl-CoA transferase
MRGIRVLDLSISRAGAYCTRMLAAVGAEVVVGESATGSPLRAAMPVGDSKVSAAWEYLQANKTSRVVDRGTGLTDLVAGFDVVVVEGEGDVGALHSDVVAALEAHPSLVAAVITPYGLTGPKSHWRAGPLEHWALAGHMNLNGEPDRSPLPGGGAWLTHLVGVTAAIGVQAAVMSAKSTGFGDLVEVSALEALAAGHQWSFAIYTHQGVVKQRWGNRFGEQHHPLTLFPCLDGWVCIAAITGPQWEGLCIAMDQVELLVDEDLYIPAKRFDRADELDEIIQAWTSTVTVDEAVEALQAQHTPAGSVASFADMLASEQHAVRHFWADVDGLGADVRMPRWPFVVPGAAPEYIRAPALEQADEAPASIETDPAAVANQMETSAVRPLSGVRMVEFSIAWAGPMVGRFMADLGAEVIKVEHPTARGLAMPDPSLIAAEAGDWKWGEVPGPLSRNGVFLNNDPGDDWFNRVGHWNKMNRGKRGVCLDVKGEGGLEILEALVASADVVLNNYSPRGVVSLGIDSASLRAIRDDVVTVAMSGFGATGPQADSVSWGPVLDAASGLASSTGYSDSGPYKQGIAFPDLIGGLHGTVATLGALWERWVSGSAVHVDLSQLETAVALAGDQILETSLLGEQPGHQGARMVDFVPSGVYRAVGDDEWFVLSIEDEAAWQALVGVVGGDLGAAKWHDVETRRSDHDAIDQLISGWAASQTKFETVEVLQAAGVRSAAVMTISDVVADPQSVERGLLVDHARDGEEAQLFPGLAIRFHRAGGTVNPPPRLGEHNAPVLAGLGFSEAQIEALTEIGTLATAPPV